jgi:hypothetical protein
MRRSRSAAAVSASASVARKSGVPRQQRRPRARSPVAVENGSVGWQHPFVDVFKAFEVAQFSVAERVGDVVAVLVSGASPGAACPFTRMMR